MGIAVLYVVLLVVSLLAVGRGEESLWRDDFPKSFVFGAGSSAYQVEGAAAEDGRAQGIWDKFAHAGNLGTGDIASDEYHKYKEDVRLMRDLGLDGYRFSISWSRLIPDGRGRINQKGLDYYNNLIDELVIHGIQPHVTLYHFDHPQVLEDEYGGFLSPKIIDDFTAYADICFREFGDRVSHWTTINEPNAFAMQGYTVGMFPPGRCSNFYGFNCTHSNSLSEAYIVAHNCLLAHSSVVSLYRRKYQAKQRGLIGLNVLTAYFLPMTKSKEDITAVRRVRDFFFNWFIEPLVRGVYPKSMRMFAGKKIPEFSQKQAEQLIGSFDFIGVNYYTMVYVEDNPNSKDPNQRDYISDRSVNMKEGDENSYSEVAYGLLWLLEYLKQAYGNPPIYIHENGLPMPYNGTLNDTPRVKYLSANLGSLHKALRNGCDIRGYFVWSLLDSYEILGGYKLPYGLYYVDFGDKDLRRYPKLSAHWYSNFLQMRGDAIFSSNSVQSSGRLNVM